MIWRAITKKENKKIKNKIDETQNIKSISSFLYKAPSVPPNVISTAEIILSPTRKEFNVSFILSIFDIPHYNKNVVFYGEEAKRPQNRKNITGVGYEAGNSLIVRRSKILGSRLSIILPHFGQNIAVSSNTLSAVPPFGLMSLPYPHF